MRPPADQSFQHEEAEHEPQSIPLRTVSTQSIHQETAKALAAYANYEALGEGRSLPKLHEWYQMGVKRDKEEGIPPRYIPSLSNLLRWSAQHNWQQRMKDYEKAQLEERRKKRESELDRMDEEHARFGRVFLARALQQIERLLTSEDVTFAGAVTLMRTSYELERLARGAVTSRIESDTTLTVLPKEYINISQDEEGSEP